MIFSDLFYSYTYSYSYQGYQGLGSGGVSSDFKPGSGLQYQYLYVTKDAKASGYVSLSHLPSRDENGSSAQFSNDAKGSSDIFIEHFKHVFSAIGPTGTEIRSFNGLGKKNCLMNCHL